MENVKEIKAGDFESEVVNSPIPVVVDFFATWCPPCKALAPVLDRVAGGYTGKIKFVKLNTDEAPELSADMPTPPMPLPFKVFKVTETGSVAPVMYRP